MRNQAVRQTVSHATFGQRAQAPRLQSGPVTLYAQISSILRDRILTGTWKHGEEIPTLDQLVEEFEVARVTVRQAVQLLADEQLLSSQRGRRTFVTYESPAADGNPLYSSTGSIAANDRNYSIEIFAREELSQLPPQFTGLGTPFEKYMRVRKVDAHNGIPYAVSDNFVALPLYKRFPANADKKVKLSRLVRDFARPKLIRGHEQIKVAALTYDDATRLQTSMGSPAAFVTRVFLSPGDRICYFGQFLYRADRFAVDRDITELLLGA